MSDRASTSGSAVPIIDIDESDTSSSNSNPWPNLAEYFKFKSQEGKSLKFVNFASPKPVKFQHIQVHHQICESIQKYISANCKSVYMLSLD